MGLRGWRELLWLLAAVGGWAVAVGLFIGLREVHADAVMTRARAEQSEAELDLLQKRADNLIKEQEALIRLLRVELEITKSKLQLLEGRP